MGDLQGHEFHGNQWTGGLGAEAQAALDSAPFDLVGVGKWRKANQGRYANDQAFRTVADMIMLHTQGDYQITNAMTMRDNTGNFPERFLDSAIPGWYNDNRSYSGNPMSKYKNALWPGNDLSDVVPGRLTWAQSAHLMNQAIERSEPIAQELHRGMSGSRVVEAMKILKPGDTFDVPGVSSFTVDQTLAEDFAQGVARGQGGKRSDPNLDNVIVTVEPGARGLRAQALSPWKQSEVITNGRFTVVSVTEEAGRHQIRQRGYVHMARTTVVRVRVRQTQAGRIR